MPPDDFTWPIYIEVEDGKVTGVWYDSSRDNQDYLLKEGEDYHVEYCSR